MWRNFLTFQRGLFLTGGSHQGAVQNPWLPFVESPTVNLILGDLKKPSFDPTLTPPSEPDMTFVPADGQL